ncbi:DUF2726 domain-containing protein [Enterococcus asini]|uniref:DUF2726 domain-containing protein n=1 Tax=Enterococcus asini TaxID=57732 RepID=UPI002891EC69|nr:DUF2726 domain-containing protein [Enterococcus asini]MDT2783126.1 DUF2726 domain-containing protein [Enterococcus asini]
MANVKWSTELAREYVSSVGCTLLSDYIPDYLGNMRFRCACGREFERSWHSFCAERMDSCKTCRKGELHNIPLSFYEAEEVVALLGTKILSSKEKYHSPNSVLEFRCKDCGNSFTCSFARLWRSRRCRCQKCSATARRLKVEEFANRLEEVHGDSIVIVGKFTGTMKPVMVTCASCHHTWFPMAYNLLNGTGCPKCAATRGERSIALTLKNRHCLYRSEYTFDTCIGTGGGMCRFDCAVLDSLGQSPLLLIEYDGIQHFEPVEFFGGQQGFEYRQRNDRIKDSYCKDHGIPLLRISYKQFDQIEQLVTDKLYELNILRKEAA